MTFCFLSAKSVNSANKCNVIPNNFFCIFESNLLMFLHKSLRQHSPTMGPESTPCFASCCFKSSSVRSVTSTSSVRGLSVFFVAFCKKDRSQV